MSVKVLSAVFASALLLAGAAQAGSVCVKVSEDKWCYASGIGAKKFCRDIIVATPPAQPQEDPPVAIGSLAIAPPTEAKVARGLFSQRVRLQSPVRSGVERTVAVVGSKAEIAAGRAELFVADANGRPISYGEVDPVQVVVADPSATLSMAALIAALDPAVEPID